MASHFEDERPAKIFGSLFRTLISRAGASLHAACEDWPNTKADYRILPNDRATEQEILASHFVKIDRRVLSSANETIWTAGQSV